jgi:cysteinyl-tRNA synthetase
VHKWMRGTISARTNTVIPSRQHSTSESLTERRKIIWDSSIQVAAKGEHADLVLAKKRPLATALPRPTATATPPRIKYSICKDAGPNISKLSNDEIHQLLRAYASTTDTDRIREYNRILEDTGVFVNNRTHHWRADGVFHGYMQASDAGPNCSSLTDKEIHAKLSERHKNKLRGYYSLADRILEELAINGVYVSDRSHTWRADGIHHDFKIWKGASRTNVSQLTDKEIHEQLSLRTKLKATRQFEEDTKLQNEMTAKGVFVDTRIMQWRADGVMHGYTLDPDAGPKTSTATDKEIHGLLARLTQARWNRADPEVLNKIRVELIEAGVYVNIVNDTWRADGVWHNFIQVPDAGPNQSKLSDSEISSLLALYLEAKIGKQVASASSLLQQLLDANVAVHTKKRQWRADGKFYFLRQHPDSGPNVSKFTDEEIHLLLNQFGQSMLYRNYTRATDVQRKLFAGGVRIDEGTDLWRADGVNHSFTIFRDAGHNTSTLSDLSVHKYLNQFEYAAKKKDYRRGTEIVEHLLQAGVFVDHRQLKWRADGVLHHFTRYADAQENTSSLTDSAIHRILSERTRAKRRRDPKKDLELQLMLSNAGVFVHEKTREWRADGCMHSYKLHANAGPNQSRLSNDEIVALLNERFQCQFSGKFQRATELRHVLFENGVFVDDRTCEWRADGIMHDYRLSSGAGPNVSNFSDEEIHSLLSQVRQAKMNREFARADEVQNKLIDGGVCVMNKMKEWRADGVFPKGYRKLLS